MSRLVSLVTDAFHTPESTAYRWTQGVVWAAIALSILLIGLELWMGGRSEVAWVSAVDQYVLVFFVIEITLRVATFRPPMVDFMGHRGVVRWRDHLWGRVRYLLQPLNLIDLLATLALVPALRGLRALRLLRLLRSRTLFRYSNPFEGLVAAFSQNGVLYAFAFTLLAAGVGLGGLSIWLVEQDTIENPADGIWWALVTITTVGYGDITPATRVGQVLAGVLMVFGMFMLALFAGIVGTTMLSAVLSIREETFRMSSYVNHLIICGYTDGAQLLLDAVEADLGTHDVVIFAEGERPPTLPPRFLWVSGDPTKDSELAKARMGYAGAVIVVGSRDVSPQQADASTILTIFTIRSYLRRHKATPERARSLYVVAEILDAENVEHAKAAGSDEVIETTRLGFSLLAHAVSQPGTASAMSRVASPEANSLWVLPAPPSLPLPMSFADVVSTCKSELDILVIGYRASADDLEEVNPPARHTVPAGVELLYLARSPLQVSRSRP